MVEDINGKQAKNWSAIENRVIEETLSESNNYQIGLTTNIKRQG